MLDEALKDSILRCPLRETLSEICLWSGERLKKAGKNLALFTLDFTIFLTVVHHHFSNIFQCSERIKPRLSYYCEIESSFFQITETRLKTSFAETKLQKVFVFLRASKNLN